jgi:hypothetical protein
MATIDFFISVDVDKPAVPTQESIDIRDLIEAVPTVKVIEGNPRSAVRVRVDKHEVGKLEAAVGSFCTMDEYADLDLY